ncbi:MAG TPA: tRNA epoxyqueuosine(34) reductase QueG [Acidimicrobiales bacterium]|nr:tRNA epoxyqueuosine(34) reductase QueG [Acidimicrobiales bacterium]
MVATATEYADDLLAVGRAAGLDATGIASASVLDRARAALDERKAAGLHDGMAFTYRNPARATEPARLLAGARAIVVGARSYRRQQPARPAGLSRPAGRVARYAWTDHYAALRASLGAVAERLRADGHRARVVADDNGLVDREVAYRAGIGWFGKNANLLLPGQGSWFVLGAVVTTAELPPARVTVADGCGTCQRCVDGCPTGAIIAPGVVDAGRCLAWLVQKPGVFPRQYRRALGDRIYGCDDCQEVCPPNQRTERRHPAPPADDAHQAWVPLLELLAADDATLLARHGRWYIPQRDPRWLRRNALIALGNTADPDDPAVGAALDAALHDADPTLRAHAVWAARRLGRDDLVGTLAGDPDPDVRAELDAR